MKNLALLMNFLGNERDSVETSQTQETKKQGRKNPMKMMSIIGFCLSLFTICLSSGAAEAARARVNSRSGLNVRREPSVNSTRVGGLSNGQVVNTTGRFSNGWAQLSNGYWVSNSYLNYNGGGTGGGTRSGGPYAQVTASRLNVRSGPSTNNRIVGRLRNGTVVQTSGRRYGDWVLLTNGNWVYEGFLSYNLPRGGVTGGGTGGGSRPITVSVNSYAGGANIRSGPGVGSRRLNYYRNGTPLTLTGRTRNGWYELTRGRGWIAGNLIVSGSDTDV